MGNCPSARPWAAINPEASEARPASTSSAWTLSNRSSSPSSRVTGGARPSVRSASASSMYPSGEPGSRSPPPPGSGAASSARVALRPWPGCPASGRCTTKRSAAAV